MPNRLTRLEIAKVAALSLPDGAVVNLGIGIPSLCADFIPPGIDLRYHAENGILGFREIHPDGEGDPNVMDAGGKFPITVPGMAFFDSVRSFDLIRGGHIDVTVLGGLQVSEQGDLANWMIPERMIGSIGGAMDLAVNAGKVVIAMEHTTKNQSPKLVKECNFPLTAPKCVDRIVTDIAVIDVTSNGLLLREVAPGWDVESVQELTEPLLITGDNVREMALE